MTDDIVAIPGTKRHTYLEENVAACDVELTDVDLKRLGATLSSQYGDSPERE